jgi:hypothetical protein
LLASKYKLKSLKASKTEKYGPSKNTLLQARIHINLANGCNCCIMISITTKVRSDRKRRKKTYGATG